MFASEPEINENSRDLFSSEIEFNSEIDTVVSDNESETELNTSSSGQGVFDDYYDDAMVASYFYNPADRGDYNIRPDSPNPCTSTPNSEQLNYIDKQELFEENLRLKEENKKLNEENRQLKKDIEELRKKLTN